MILEHAENHFQRAFNVTQQLYILVLHWAKMFFCEFQDGGHIPGETIATRPLPKARRND
jgi:hypothetical protein